MPDTRKRIARKGNTIRRLEESNSDEEKKKLKEQKIAAYDVPDTGYDYPLPEDSWPGSENGRPVNDWPRTDNPVGRMARDERTLNRRKNRGRQQIDAQKEARVGRQRERDRNILISRRGHKDPGDNQYPDARQTSGIDRNKIDTKSQQLNRLDVGKNEKTAETKLKDAAKNRLQRAGRK